MQLSLDQLVWGNPCQEHAGNLGIKGYLDELLPDLYKQSPFLNSSAATRNELDQLVQYGTMQEYSARRNIFDGELVPYINDLFCRNGCDKDEITTTTMHVVKDVQPF